MRKLPSSWPLVRVEGGSEPHSHPSFLDENNDNGEHNASSEEFILEQPSPMFGIFSLESESLEFGGPFQTFACPGMCGISRFLGQN